MTSRNFGHLLTLPPPIVKPSVKRLKKCSRKITDPSPFDRFVIYGRTLIFFDNILVCFDPHFDLYLIFLKKLVCEKNYDIF
jgi:hypothetical protein